MAQKPNKQNGSITYTYCRSVIIQAVKNKAYSAMLSHMKECSPNYWGEKDGIAKFDEYSLAVYLYMNIEDCSYDTMTEICSKWYPVSKRSLEHNCEMTSSLLQRWAEKQITVGTRSEWIKACRKVKMDKRLKGVNLWMDSSDFGRIGKRSVSRKSKSWSYKLNRPAQRNMVICDARRRARRVWGPYSPKLYDGDFIAAACKTIDNDFPDTKILADNHFAQANNYCKKAMFLVNHKEPAQPKDKEMLKGLQKLTKKELSYNEAHRKARARVESPFGQIKTMFKSLKTAYRKNEEEQEKLVYIAFAIHNVNIKE